MRQPIYLMRLLICCGLFVGSVHAQISTSPLTSQTWVPPNVVVTLDDSGSMHDECIPNSRCIGGLNAGSAFRRLVHPPVAAIPYQPSGSTSVHPIFKGVLSYNDDSLEIRQQRSSSFNKTYYDPGIEYKPWVTPTGSYPNVTDAASAQFDPRVPSQTFSLSGEVTYIGTFCTSTSESTCSPATQTFKPARYYVLRPGQSGTDTADFNEIIIANETSFAKGANRRDCARASSCTQAEELQNFSNWFTYNRVVSKFLGDPFTVYPATYNPNNLFAMQMRSAATNSAYYNPERRYTPWIQADLSAYANATISAARYNPNEPAYTIDLSSQISATEFFCNGPYRADCHVNTQTFYPAQYYVKSPGTDGSDKSHFTQVVINTGNSFRKSSARTDCAGETCTRDEELQNFANWFTYYRTKWLAAKAAISQTFKVIPGEVRLGYGSISVPIDGNEVDGELTGVIKRGVRPFNDTARRDFYNWLLNLNTNTTGAGTPLRRAMVEVGNYYMRNDNAGPWAETPGGTSTSAHKVCRRALHLMITDGAWTQRDDTQLTNIKTGPGNRSVATYSLIGVNVDGDYAYPFKDTHANTLADVAMYYWKTDLRSDLRGKVTVPQSEKDLGRDTNRPHMVNYLIGFGVNGTLRNPEDSADLISNRKAWPRPADEATKVDDMWHAAWNSGGQAFNATDPKDLSESLGRVIESMKEQVGSDAPLVLPSRFVSSNYLYIPSYKSKVWSGDLQAYNFDRATGDRQKDADGNYTNAAWSAASQLNSKNADNRNIYTLKGSTGIEFNYATLNSNGLISTLTSESEKAEGLINYLRGSATLEGETQDERDNGKIYRKRPDGKLGDIVNSPPLLVFDAEDASYDFLAPPSSGRRGNYRQFLLDKKKRVGQVFVGANDGMLHAFNANTGEETFAFIPKTVLGDVYRLSDPSYAHRYYVDGPLVEADVYDNNATLSETDTGWRNIVVGTGGAGARNLFAIKVPVQSNGDSNTVYPPGASDILWEINHTTTEFEGLGHVLQKPAVGMMRDGTWVVVVGNGYVNSDGTAKLYILNALTGAFIKSIDVPGDGNNGLGGVRLVLDLQRQITAAYAGDLEGNLWKFDFSSELPANWGVAFGGKPLFKAQFSSTPTGSSSPTVQNQPITAAPVYLAHPQGGNLVVFGTGKLFELADPGNTKVQTLYAVWDKVITGQPSDAAAATATADTPSGSTIVSIVSIGSLVEQTMTAIANTSYYSASKNLVNYPGKRGWFIKLNMNPVGLRSIFPPQLAVGKVFVQTLSPSNDANDACAERSSKTVNFVLNPFTGSASSPTFDVNADGRIDTADGVDSSSNAINAVAVISDGASYATFSQKVGSGINTGVLTNATSQKTVTGASNALRRTWRQIINRPRPAAAAPSPAGG